MMPKIGVPAEKIIIWTSSSPQCWFSKVTYAFENIVLYNLMQITLSSPIILVIHIFVYFSMLMTCSSLVIQFGYNQVQSIFKYFFPYEGFGNYEACLRVKVTRNTEGIQLCQQKCVLEVVYEVGLSRAKPTSTPMAQNHQLAKSTSPFFDMPDRYRHLVGKLIYLSLARLELAYVVTLQLNSCSNSY